MKTLTRLISALNNNKQRSRIVLLLALLNGFLYLFLVPPWQHYDEPTHFEYAWLIANRGTLPQPGDYDPAMRREVAASMIEHNFFQNLGSPPNLLIPERPIWIGASELSHPPFYYLLAAIPLRLTRFADVTFQLYSARGVSLALYVFSVWLAGRIVAEIVGEGHILQWAVPGMMALLPAYTDLMTAVNNDVGAVVVFSLFLWGAIRAIRYGFSWPRLIWVTGAAALCIWTKNTAAIATFLAPLALALSMFRGSRRWPIWLGFAAASLGLAIAAVGWGDAAFWYRQNVKEEATRDEQIEAPLGKAVLTLKMTPTEPGRNLWQPLLRTEVEALRGQTVTLGAWIWASEPTKIRSPMLDDGYQAVWKPIEVGSAPVFYAITTTIATQAEGVKVVLRPIIDQASAQTVTVYYDGIVLAEGTRPLNDPPIFDDVEGEKGYWGGRSFVNRVRNGSAETAWPQIRGWVHRALSIFGRVPFDPSQMLGSVLDWQRTVWVYPQVMHTLIRSFWAYFGWGHVQLPSPVIYWFLEGATALGLVSAATFGTRKWRSLSPSTHHIVVFLMVTTAWVWINAALRVHPSLLSMPYPRIPVARYAFPAIIPTSTGLVWGWLQIAPSRRRGQVAVAALLLLLLLNGFSLTTIIRFYS